MVATWHNFAVDSTKNPWDFSMPPNTSPLNWTFTQRRGTWLYCNFPEQLPAAALGDGNAGCYINFGLVNGPAMVYASHSNHTGGSLYFGIQLYNGSTTNVTVTPGKWGYRTDTGYAVINVWRDFYNSTPGAAFTLKPYESRWIMVDKPAANGMMFNAAQQFTTSGELGCYVYVYRAFGNLTGTATLYPHTTENEIRGTGTATFLDTPTAGTQVDVTNGGKWNWFTNACQYDNQRNEMVEITDPGPAKQKFNCATWAGKIGNFGLQYGYNVRLYNANAAKRTVQLFIADGNYIHTNNYVRYGSSHDGGPLLGWNHDLTALPANHARGNERWNFLTVDAPQGNTMVSFEHIMCGNSNTPVLLQIEAV